MEFRILGRSKLDEGRELPLGGANNARCSRCCCSTPTAWSHGPPDRRALAHASARHRPDGAPGVRLPAAQGIGRDLIPTQPPATSSGSATVSSTSIASSGWWRRRARRSPPRPPGCSGKGWPCGGAPLAELGDSFARAERARLEEQRLAALEQRIEAELALGRHAELVPELEGLVREQPLRERLRGQLMLASIAAAARQTRSRSTARAGGCWTRSSGSSRTMSSNASRKPSSTTILRSSRR